MSVGDAFNQVWDDVTTQVVASTAAALWPLAAVVVCLLVPQVWHIVRHVVTIAHEAGHAGVAVLLGRSVSGIRLHADTSGLTTHSGSTKRLPLALTAFAGYPAPAVLGLGAAVLLGAGYAFALLWIAVLLLVVVLVQIRNVYGFLVMVLAVAGVGWLAWAGADPWRVGVAYAVAWLLLLGAVRAVVELHGSRRTAEGRTSDADALARSTRVPGVIWVGVFWLVTVACAAGGAWLMLGDVVGG
ncbi:M50 family metallopeptidase [Demequina sp. TTPB684]|uniref:M50 family metallopeptidase n=1 Tax=unclassified Demequina TaxID=2620311 RepID=UPI001CF0F4DA|nr:MULTISPECIES: M50 family metallopeptidase [unclassified Demequina]MCB2413467.1 M50 family metallopeptidase [Demequina sp. TTPB684]UPU88770.1 M50 family metallopeptidase [Demequina sp. TMPB413]